MKKLIVSLFVVLGFAGTVYACNYPQNVVQQEVQYDYVPQVERVVQYVEVPQLKVVEREVYVPQQVQKVQKVQKVVVKKQRAQPVRQALKNVQKQLQRRQRVVQKEVVIEKQVNY